MTTLRDLHADGPAPEHARELMLFGQLVGDWELDVTWFHDDGTTTTLPGRWSFGWILGGRGVQDVWRVAGREHGTTIRFYDPALGAWRSTWHGPARGVVMPFIARAVGDEIVLEGSFDPGVTTRWIFSEITPRAFRWRNVTSRDGGATWATHQEMRVRRC
jgi:hypothetical protein